MNITTDWYTEFFVGKKITVMGLGILGRGIADALFLLESGAELIITDLKTEEELQSSIAKLSKYENQIEWVLGKHRKKDFKNRDMVLHASSVPLKNEYLQTAKDNKVPVHMSAGLLVSLLRKAGPATTVIGITGSKGKSTTTEMIRTLLDHSDQPYHLGGNIRGVATLPLIKKIKENDIVLLELDSWQLQGFGYARISPDIAVFTNFFPDHMDYYKGSMKAYFKDKANIFRYQKEPACYVSSQAKQVIKEYGRSTDLEKTRCITTSRLPDYQYQVLGDHMLANLALAHQVGIKLELSDAQLKKGLTAFKPVEGRMQYLKQVDGVHFYNDNNSTTPESTILSLQCIRKKHPDQTIIWLAGGARKDTDYSLLGSRATRAIDHALFFRGEGTNDMVEYFPKKFSDYVRVDSMDAAFSYIARTAQKTDVVVLSPAASSFGMFTNEYDRNDQFLKAVKKFTRSQ